LARALETNDAIVTVFLMADAVVCAMRGQKVPKGFYNIQLMLESVIRKGEALLCGTFVDARGITNDDIVAGSKRSTTQALAECTLKADQVPAF
jgi:uncharacterized protein involved in oxidation of intracellular sulfur